MCLIFRHQIPNPIMYQHAILVTDATDPPPLSLPPFPN